jgi:hypothetical protein
MAKRGNDQGADSDKGKIRIFFAEVEGNNESLQHALKTVVAAMNRSGAVQLTAPTARIGTNPSAATSAKSERVVSESDEATDTTDDGTTETNDTPPTRKRGLGPKRDRNDGIKLDPDIDFVPEGKQSLKQFFAEKAPKSDMEQILVLVYYMQQTLGRTVIGPGHILTAFKHVEKPVPVDIRATVRNMKRAKAWLTFTDMEALRVGTNGANHVEHELPSRKKL